MGEVLCSTENSPFLHAKINRVCCAALAIGKRCMNVRKNKLFRHNVGFRIALNVMAIRDQCHANVSKQTTSLNDVDIAPQMACMRS